MNSTKIEWAQATWNPITGCTPVSEGCANCYAKRMATRLRGRCGYPADDPFRIVYHHKKYGEPLRWKKPRLIFVCSMGDLFHKDVDARYLSEIFWVMKKAKQHTFLLLTKRPENVPRHESWWDKNIWLGVSAENQQRADERIPILLQIPAAVRFVSVEPMLGSVDLTKYLGEHDDTNKHGEDGLPVRFQRRVRDRPKGTDMARKTKGVGSLEQDDQAEQMPTQASRAQNPPRIPTDSGHVLPKAISCVGPQASMATFLRPDTRGEDDQPQERGKRRQPSIEFGSGNLFGSNKTRDPFTRPPQEQGCSRSLQWCIVGGETGPGARPMHSDWARSLRDQCVDAGVPFFFKKHGDWWCKQFYSKPAYRENRELDGREWNETPACTNG